MMILLLDIRDNSPPPQQQHHRPRYALTHLTINMLLLKFLLTITSYVYIPRHVNRLVHTTCTLTLPQCGCKFIPSPH